MHCTINTLKLASGYIVLENFASPGECAALVERANSLVEGFNPEKVSVFSTTNQVPTNYHSTICLIICKEVNDPCLQHYSLDLSWPFRVFHDDIIGGILSTAGISVG